MVAPRLSRARLGLGFALLVPLVLSCADLPTTPVPTVRMTGSVRNNEGQPMPFMAVDFWIPGLRSDEDVPAGEQGSYRAITRADGTFEIWLPARTYDVQTVPWEGSGYSRAWVRSVPVGPDAPRLDYRYAWPRVRVRTVQPDGSVIPNSRVRFWPNDPSIYYAQTVARPDSGATEAVVPPGSYLVYISPGGPESGYFEEFTTLSVAGDTTITITAGGNAVSARVLGQNGTPLQGARVYTFNTESFATARTGADGIAVLHLPSGGYSFRVRPSETYIASRAFPTRSITGPESFDLDVSGVVWSGVVRRAGDGVPLSGIEVAAYGRAGVASLAYVPSDAGGAFRLIVERNAAYDIELTDLQSFEEIGLVSNVFAGSDSTFDLIANIPVP
jgi:hypothetical protein